MNKDPELARLLLLEFVRHEPEFGDVAKAKRAIHALKGSASLAGERELAEALARLERRIASGDDGALDAARALVAATRASLSRGEAPPLPVWPEPPDDLLPRAATDPQYEVEMRDRLARVDEALRGGGPSAIAAVYREVHAMKGAALASSDEALAWFCHGLEERLRAGERGQEDAATVLDELSRLRFVWVELLVAPERALASLRASAPPRSARPRETVPPRSRGGSPDSEARSSSVDDSLRVPTATLDRLVERVRQIGQSRGQVSAGARVVESLAGRARKLRLLLAEAMRLIGPPRPWGAPAAAITRLEQTATSLGAFSERLDEEAVVLKETADRVRGESAAAQMELAEIRTTRVAWLFDRVAAAALADARRRGLEVRFAFRGEDSGIDRRVAEQLLDPLMQLARNAVAHGIEPAAERAMRGKPRVFGIELSAERRGGGLRVTVRDDGAGVDVADVRRRAVARAMIGADTASVADDATLLALLFVPGFTTKDGADLLSGRGVGLDLTLEAVHRLGGTIRLSSDPGMGLSATLDIPFEPGLVRIVWIEAGEATYAIPVRDARGVVLTRDDRGRRARPLARLLDPSADASETGLAIELEPAWPGARPIAVGVDAVGVVEEVALRALSPLVRTAGPFSGAIVRGDELRLCLDGLALAELAARS